MLRNMEQLHGKVDLTGWDSTPGYALSNLMLEAVKLLLVKALPQPEEE